jgi:DNA modification methylase
VDGAEKGGESMTGDLYKILQGDCLEVLRTLPDASVHCVVTSPPYFNLRDYGIDGQLGLEKRHDCSGWATGERCGECFVCRLTAVFSEVRRVLRDDGTCWVNIGDSYSANRGYQVPDSKHKDVGNSVGMKAPPGIPPKNLLLVPQRLALSLQQYGWIVRSEIIWAKRNPMPESVTDRPTKAHEQVWMLSKSSSYFYDAEAIKEEQSAGTLERYGTGKAARLTTAKTIAADEGEVRANSSFKNSTPDAILPNGRNKRSVWEIPLQSYDGAHFATFPEALVEPCILAGCPVGGVTLDPFCGSGTTGAVALRLDRRFLGLELNESYIELAHKRIRAVPLPIPGMGMTHLAPLSPSPIQEKQLCLYQEERPPCD